MPRLYPFKALRPNAKYIEKVSAKSSDFPVKDDLVREIQNNPYSFHHVTKSHLRYSGSFQSPEKFLPFALNYIRSMKNEGALEKEDEDCFYYYEQVLENGYSFKGIIALYVVEDYSNNLIKRHEEIRPNRLQYLVEVFKTAKVLGEPTLLAFKGSILFDQLVKEPIFSFNSPDGKTHHLSKISLPNEIAKLSNEFEKIDNFYIADGHHRSAAAEKFNSTAPSKFNNDKTMCFVVAEDQLKILPFHRLINPVSLVDKDDLISMLSEKFEIFRSYESLYDVKEQGTFGLYIKKEWYQLKYRNNSNLLDVEIIENEIIRNVFRIMDSRTDSQIAFHPHTNGEKELCNLIDCGIYQIAITNKSCNFKDVRHISDEGRTLPPKSTYIEPKLRSGMVIQEF